MVAIAKPNYECLKKTPLILAFGSLYGTQTQVLSVTPIFRIKLKSLNDHDIFKKLLKS